MRMAKWTFGVQSASERSDAFPPFSTAVTATPGGGGFGAGERPIIYGAARAGGCCSCRHRVAISREAGMYFYAPTAGGL